MDWVCVMLFAITLTYCLLDIREILPFFLLEDSRTRKHSLLKLGLALAFDTGSTFACGPIHIEFFCVFKMDKAGYPDVTSV